MANTRDVSSFVTLALSHGTEKSAPLSADKPGSIKNLLARYNHIKDMFPSIGNIDGIHVPDDCIDKICLDNVDPYAQQKEVKISQGQLEIAKEVGKRVTEIDFLYKTGAVAQANDKHSDFLGYIGETREGLYGDFKTVGEIDEVIAANAIGANGDPTASVIGVVVVYVGVEIYAMS